MTIRDRGDPAPGAAGAQPVPRGIAWTARPE